MAVMAATVTPSTHQPLQAAQQAGRRAVHEAHGRVLAPGLAWLDPDLPDDIAKRSPLAVAWRQLDKALESYIAGQMVAAYNPT